MNLPQKNWLEWLVFGLSALLVLSVLGYLGATWLTQTSTPPDIVVEPGTPVYTQADIRVPVLVSNHGDTAAQSVEVAVELAGIERQQGHFVIDLLPPHATLRGWVAFSADSHTSPRISARVVGYQEP